VLGLNEIEMDFILECYAKDHPDQWKFIRPGKPPPPKPHDYLAAWENRLIGKAHDILMSAIRPSAAVLKRAAEIATSSNLLRRLAKQQETPPPPGKPDA
jgi:hypothetical protein